ncbi:uncharacterized protein TNCT_679691 [Trichonephila clavata]|uniref:Uncharacterized protein n=1 Tax=Trichonephila clavata TaxID=2740835 RepID=A0A8X6L8U6_TRICU|nr:uncharacterized protein TNCT_679691 [Trichonephila clavata]
MSDRQRSFGTPSMKRRAPNDWTDREFVLAPSSEVSPMVVIEGHISNLLLTPRSRPDRFKPFVKNRVEEIQKLSNPSDWHHCPGKENPADFLTRGLSVKSLKKCDAWWNGPHWLHQPEENWPKIEVKGRRRKELGVEKEI